MKVDYTQGKIYKITNDYNEDVYIGSTCDTLVKRFSAHKRSSYNEKTQHRPLYTLINEIGFERFRIQLIENYACEDLYQLRQKEGEYIRKLGTLNKLIAGREFSEYSKEYRQGNKEILQEKDKQKYLKNRDKRLSQAKEYYENNKETIKASMSEIIVCECGCTLSKAKLKRHKETKKHNDLMNNINI
jgi:hypothetical protein